MSIILFGIFLVLLMLGAPIVFAIGVGTLGALLAGGIPLELLPQKVFSGLAHFPYLAVPLFVLAGVTAKQPSVHGDTITMYDNQCWTPADAWLSR